MLWGLAKSVYNSADQLAPEIQALLQRATRWHAVQGTP